ncbi:hypothetical protein ACET3Z_026582 [Daucus carota]
MLHIFMIGQRQEDEKWVHNLYDNKGTQVLRMLIIACLISFLNLDGSFGNNLVGARIRVPESSDFVLEGGTWNLALDAWSGSSSKCSLNIKVVGRFSNYIQSLITSQCVVIRGLHKNNCHLLRLLAMWWRTSICCSKVPFKVSAVPAAWNPSHDSSQLNVSLEGQRTDINVYRQPMRSAKYSNLTTESSHVRAPWSKISDENEDNKSASAWLFGFDLKSSTDAAKKITPLDTSQRVHQSC